MGIGEALSLACALNWAVVLLLFRKVGRVVSPFSLNLTKNSIALALFAPTILIWDGWSVPEIPGADWAVLLVSGFIGIAVADTLLFRSLNLLGAGLLAILECLYSPFVILLSILWLDERLTGAQVLGCVFVLLAILLVTATERIGVISRTDVVRGTLLGAAGLLIMAISVVMAKPVLDRTPLLWTIEIRYLAGVLGLLAVVPFMKGRWASAWPRISSRQWGVVGGSAFLGAYLQIILWMGGMKYTQASIAAVLNQTATIFTILLAAVVLKEPLTRPRVGGALLAMGGVLLITLG